MAEYDTAPTQSTRPERADDKERKEMLHGLAAKIQNLWSKRANERITKDGEWDSCLKLYHAPLVDGDNYYADRPFEQKPSRKRPTPNIVRTKCDTAVANSVSMQFAGGEKNWDLFPPANVGDPLISDACRAMEKEIEAQLDAGNYPLQARKAIEDRVILGTGILKGPVNTGRMRTKYVKQGDSWVPTVVQDHSPSVERVAPWRFYPDMSVISFEESVDAIEYHPYTKLDLSQKRKHPGFDQEAIDEILHGEHGIKADEYNANYLSNVKSGIWSSKYMYKDRYTVLEYHGPVTYDDACKLGLDPTYESPTQEYYGEVWVCCGKVIRLELENIEAQYETPYSVATWKKDPSSPFGFGHPLLLADAQRVITQSYHMILDNASLTSGPQVAMFQQYVQPVDGTYDIVPNKAWLLNDPTVSIKDAISFFTPTNVIGNIMPVLALAKQFAEEESATISPTDSPQNVESATGQLIQAANSTTVLDFLAEEWDDQVTEKIIRRFYAWNMQYNNNEAIKGDYVVDVKSSTEYKNKQMHIRDLERLSMETQQNPQMALWINQDELQRSRLALMKLPSNKIVRTKEEYLAAVEQQKQTPDPVQMELQIAQAEAMRADKELDLKQQRLEFEKNQQMTQLQWDHEEKMGSNYARVQEAQASVIKSQNEVQVEMFKLAAKDKAELRKLQSDTFIKKAQLDGQVFMHAQTENREATDALINAELYQKELDYASKKGKGI